MGMRHHGALHDLPVDNIPSFILRVLEVHHLSYDVSRCAKTVFQPYDGGKLAAKVQTNALSSHISSLRALLEIEQRKPVEARITQAKGVICERRTVNGKPRFFYRLEY